MFQMFFQPGGADHDGCDGTHGIDRLQNAQNIHEQYLLYLAKLAYANLEIIIYEDGKKVKGFFKK